MKTQTVRKGSFVQRPLRMCAGLRFSHHNNPVDLPPSPGAQGKPWPLLRSSSAVPLHRQPAGRFNRLVDVPGLAALPGLAVLGGLFILLMLPLSLGAAARTVTTLADDGPNSLRETIAASVNNDTITFAVTGTIVLTSGELVIDRNLTILGPTAAPLAVSGNYASRVFNITAGTVNIANLTIKDGRAVDAPGGGTPLGGGIFNGGTLNMTNCTIRNNSAIGRSAADFAGESAGGGGIYSRGTLTLVNCTLTGNLAQGGNGGGDGNGGLTPNNGGYGQGGGIMTWWNPLPAPTGSWGYCTLINCTLSGNEAQGGNGAQTSNQGGPGGHSAGGGVRTDYTFFIAHNTLLAGNRSIAGVGGEGDISPGPDGISGGPDLAGSITSLGHNLIGKTDGSSGWIPSDLTGTASLPLDPLLGPLHDNGGPTPTMALVPSSPAVDAGDDAVVSPPMSLWADQRGLPRWSGAHVDIGAFEFCSGASLVVVVAGSGRVVRSPDQACYSPGSLVGLWATPDPGWRFAGWSGDATGTNNPLILALNNSTWITGLFEEVPNMVTNGSFEDTAGTFIPDGYGVMSLPAGSTAIPGWTTTQAELVWGNNDNIFGVTTPYGMLGLDLTGTHDALPFGGVTQTIPTALAQRYQFSLSLGSNADWQGANGRKEVRVTCGSASTNFSFQPTFSTGNEWRTFSFEFEAVSTATTITLQGVEAGGIYLGVDNVSVFEAPPVPPPALINARFGPDGFGFLLGGDASDTFRIEYSEDLRAWHTIQMGLPGGSVFVETDNTRRTAPAGYYRAVREE